MKKKGQQHTFDAAWQPLPAWQCINGYSYEVGVRNALTSSPHRGDFFSCLIPSEKKSTEIQLAEKFLANIASDPAKAVNEDPCLTVGDLLIAMESEGISHFFTLNSTESQHFCRVLGQTMIIRPVVPDKAEIVCHAEDENWPEFGASTTSE